MSSILQNISRFVDLNDVEKEAFLAICTKKQLRKKQYLVQPGFVCKHQTYVDSGALRSFFLDIEGNEQTIQFAIEDWFISDFNSYISQEPASLFVEALEDTKVTQIEYTAVENLCHEHPIFERFFRLTAQKAFAFAQRRIQSNLGNTAEERYMRFQQMYPEIVQRVPQYMLASYLGMTPEFLSKIRKNISRK